jgi:hypothetical protein
VAVKAISAGQVIGTAMSDFDCSTAMTQAAENQSSASIVLSNGICQGQVTMFIKNTFYQPAVATDGNYDLLKNTDLSVFDASSSATASDSGMLQPLYTIQDGAGVAVTDTAAYAKATIANIQVGAIIAKQISTDQLAVTTDNISIGGQTLHDYIKGIVQEVLSEQKTQNTTAFISVTGFTSASQSAQITRSIEAQKTASSSAELNISNNLSNGAVTSNQIAGLSVLNSGLSMITSVDTATLSAQTIGLDTINVSHIQGLAELTASTVTAASISAQTITADTINAKHIEGLEILETGIKNNESRINDLESLFSTVSATQKDAIATPIITPSVSDLLAATGVTAATVSGDLRVQGNGLVEGILHVADTLFANNVIVNGISDFFGNTVFHNNVTFEKTPTFNSDTAGIAVIKKGYDHVDVNFSKPYDQTPIINASITLNPITPTPGETDAQKQQREIVMESAVLGDSIHYIITKRTVNGFTIQLDKAVGEDVRFSWLAIDVKNPEIFQSEGNTLITPSPVVSLSPSPVESIFPMKTASGSAGP